MNLNYLEETIRTSKYLVCLAGMEFMREQNVAYHRDSDESYRIEEKYGYSPEELFSARMFNTHAELFYEYYLEKIRISRRSSSIKILISTGDSYFKNMY